MTRPIARTLNLVCRLVACAVALAFFSPPASAQSLTPSVSVTLEPSGPITVGTPVEVTVTILVPTFMPEPPVWPDLQIADAVTRLPERATRPVTKRIGAQSWSGVARMWKIIPQRPADFDLGPAEIAVTYADPTTSAPVQTSLPLPDITFSATVPPGAEGLDPFIPATTLTLSAAVAGLPAAPKPGDSFTLTLVTTAAGPPAMLLPSLSDQLPALPGLRAYPRQAKLDDAPGEPSSATRSDAITFVIEAPGTIEIPALSVDWWNIATKSRATATTQAVRIKVPSPPGWHEPTGPTAVPRHLWLIPAWMTLAVGFALAIFVILTRRHTTQRKAQSEHSAYRALRKTIRNGSIGMVRPSISTWSATLSEPFTAAQEAAIESALRQLERLAYGPQVHGTSHADEERRRLLSVVADARPGPSRSRPAELFGLNPVSDRGSVESSSLADPRS